MSRGRRTPAFGEPRGERLLKVRSPIVVRNGHPIYTPTSCYVRENTVRKRNVAFDECLCSVE